jgi:Family of unknown function (DUF5329)
MKSAIQTHFSPLVAVSFPQRVQRMALVFILGCAPLLSHAMDADERVKAKQLVNYIEGLSGASFIRNGKEYSPANAAQFMRLKCESKMNTLKDAREFVDQCFTRSSESGQPYQIRLPNGVVRESGPLLMEQLRRIESAAK